MNQTACGEHLQGIGHRRHLDLEPVGNVLGVSMAIPLNDLRDGFEIILQAAGNDDIIHIEETFSL